MIRLIGVARGQRPDQRDVFAHRLGRNGMGKTPFIRSIMGSPRAGHGAASRRDRDRSQGRGLSILLVEQNLYSALAVADRVYILETGQVMHQGDAAALALETELLFQRLGVQ